MYHRITSWQFILLDVIKMSDEISEKELADLKIDETEEESTNYKAPAKKTIDELNQLDAEDESLRKYKEVSASSFVQFLLLQLIFTYG